MQSEDREAFPTVSALRLSERKPICLLPRKSFAILPESIVIEFLDLLLERCRFDDYGIKDKIKIYTTNIMTTNLTGVIIRYIREISGADKSSRKGKSQRHDNNESQLLSL